MKKVIPAILFFSSILLASSPEINEIIFPFLKIDESKRVQALCDSIYSGLPEIQAAVYAARCMADGDGIQYNSPLDVSVIFALEPGNYIYLGREEQTCNAGKTEGTPGSAHFSEVLFTELMRLQQLGVILNARDSLKNLLTTEISRMKEASPCEDIDNILYDQYDEFYGDYRILKSGCCSLVNSPSALPAISWVPSIIRVTKTGENRFLIQGAKIGSAYTLFDLNGKVLEQGVMLSRVIQTPMLPAVLKIQKNTVLLK